MVIKGYGHSACKLHNLFATHELTEMQKRNNRYIIPVLFLGKMGGRGSLSVSSPTVEIVVPRWPIR